MTDGGDDSMDAGAEGSAPTVVATVGGLPASLALSGDTLYVTISESTSASADGKLVSVPKTATAAQRDGTVTTLTSGLRQPRAIAVYGSEVLWADIEASLAVDPVVFGMAADGTRPPETILSNVYTLTRLAISGSALYAFTSSREVLEAYPLSGGVGADAGGSVGQTVYPGSPPKGMEGPDGDGTNVFFFIPGANNEDLYRVGVDGNGLTDLVPNATSGSTVLDFIVDDGTDVFWSDADSGRVLSVSKTAAAGATPKTLATVASSGTALVQLALDGDNLYVLSSDRLARIPKAGGAPPVVLASVSGAASDIYLERLGNAVALAVDESFVYWLYEGHGQILKIAK